ncbi:MAG: transglycosylase family protein [Nocardiaceae bacterium]|nr:transglycosylase family protein [Nocardiaceae bacterium]
MSALVSRATIQRVTAAVVLGLALVACGSEPPPPPPPPPAPPPPPPPPPDIVAIADWEAMASCEATGDWAANTGNGFYGGLQFDAGTWTNYGGAAYAPTADLATNLQQMEVANKVLGTQGWGAWPSCSVFSGVAWKRPAAPGTFVPPAVPAQAAR